MENRKVIYTFGLLFSIAFAIIYYGLFHIFSDNGGNTVTLYYNQVGLYKNTENAQKNIASLKELGIDAYVVSKDDLHRVICGISTNQEDTKENGALLDKNNMKYIEKQATAQAAEITQALQEKDTDKILEMINNESKGNEQTGATAGESSE